MAVPDALTRDDLLGAGLGTAALGVSVASLETAEDRDYLLFAAAPGRRYALEADGRVSLALGLFAAPDLSRIAADDDPAARVGGLPAVQLATGSRPELWIVTVEAAGPGAPGAYALEIRDLGPADAPAEPDPVGTGAGELGGLAPTGPVAAEIETAGGADAYTAWLVAGRSYAVTAAGQGGLDPRLALSDPDGAPVTANDDRAPGDPTAEIVVTAAATGFHAVTVLGEGTGAYALTMFDLGARPVGAPDVADTRAEAAPLEAGLVTAGEITAGDTDMYAITLLEGTDYAIGAVGFGGLDTALALLDAEGAELLSVDVSEPGGADAIFGFTPESTGLYHLAVTGAAGSVGAFDLAVFLIEPGEVFLSEARAVALLYEAGLGRAADDAGLNFWVNAFAGGFTLTEIAGFFLASPEFAETVGALDTLTDEALVLGLYENVLQRDQDPRVADADGFAFWLAAAEAPNFSDAQLLEAFAASPENTAQAETLDALAYDPDRELEIAGTAQTGAWTFDTGL